MADDDRRAEVEAVARVLKALPEPTMAAAEPYTVARAMIAALDRVRDARGDDRPLAKRCGHVKPDVNCPACAADAFDALARVRDAEAELERLRAINAELVEAHNTLLVDAARSPQGEDHEADALLARSLRAHHGIVPVPQDEDHEAKWGDVVIWMRSRRSDLWMLAADLVEAEFSPISKRDGPDA